MHGDPTLRVLSLDGGGTWAVIQIKTLIDLFGRQSTGHDVLAQFDLAVANSGGSVILACLAVNSPLLDILNLYTDANRRRATFQSTSVEWLVDKIGGGRLPWPRYSTARKREALAKHLGEKGARPLSRWSVDHPRLAQLVITAFDYDTERATFFRTHVASLAASRSSSAPLDVSLIDAVNASTNAPLVFFDEPARVETADGRSRRYWDGALAGYNNPVMAAVAEALASRQSAPPDESALRTPASAGIHIVSIGTGTVRRPRRPQGVLLADVRFTGGEPPGALGDLQKSAGAILDDPPDAASFIAHLTLGGLVPQSDAAVTNGPIVRLSPVVRPVFDGRDWAWPPGLGDPASQEATEAWTRLTELRLDALEQEDIDLLVRFCDAWFRGEVPNQPVRARDDTLEADIGHDTYPAAKVAVSRLLTRSGATPSVAPPPSAMDPLRV